MITVLWVVLIVILLILAIGVALSFYFTKRSNLIDPHPPDEYGLEYESIEFATPDRLILRGVWISAAGSDRAIVILHGHGTSHDYDVYRAPDLHQAGFNVLLFDFRAHGRSDGKRMTFGYEECRDMQGAVEFLRQRGIKHIGLLGFSYGGMVAMVSSAQSPDIEAVISDGGPARVRTAIAVRSAELGIPLWLSRPIGFLIVGVTSLRLGVNLFSYEPIRWVGKISPRPIFFIHGDHDQYLPDFDQLYAAAKEPKELWRVAEAGHTTVSQFYPAEYSRRVIEFFKRHL